jgi:site-specific DNA recombinase
LKYDAKFKSEKMLLAKTMATSNKRVSNLDKVLNKAIEYSTKLNTLWACGDYHQKQQLPFLVFPDWILYNRKKDECRTERVNSIFSYIAQLAKVIGNKKSEHKEENFSVSTFVGVTGVEPVTLCL